MLKYSSGMPINGAMRCLSPGAPRLATCALTAVVTLMVASQAYVCAQAKPASASGDAQIAKAVGTIKSIQADSITVTSESGSEGDIVARLTGATKILRVPPGEKDLKNATSLQAQDLQPGDLLFFGASLTKITHTGMYIGNGEFIHDTTNTHPEVQISKLDDMPWTKLLVAARRVK